MKVITYNVLDGFVDAADRQKKCSAWLNKEAPDILFLNELNGFTESSLKEFAASWGHDHSVLLVGRSRYLVAITSKYPITNVQLHYQELKGHGAIFCQINGINCITTHLHPHSVDYRISDLNFLLPKINKFIALGEEVIFGGDFNAFYQKENKSYENSDNQTLEWFRLRSELDVNFLNLVKGQLDYSVIEKVSNGSLFDLLSLKNETFSKSVCTNLCQEKRKLNPNFIESGFDTKRIYSRIDYIWTTKKLLDKCERCFIPFATEVEDISDHYPIVAIFSNS